MSVLLNKGAFLETSIVAAATTDLGASNTLKVNITAGAASVNSFGARANCWRPLCRSSASFTLVHNSTSMNLPGGQDIAVTSGARWSASSDPSGNWRVQHYIPASGKAIIGPASTDITDSTATGRAAMIAANAAALATAAGAREKLTADRTYYVRADGSDANNGLADTSGGAFRQISKAVATVRSLDLNTFCVTVQVGDGAYSSVRIYNTLTGTATGAQTVPLNLNLTAAAIVTGASDHAIDVQQGARVKITGGKLVTTGTGNGLNVSNAYVSIGSIEFGACVSNHILAAFRAVVIAHGNITVSGGSGTFVHATNKSLVFLEGRTITMTGTPAFSVETIGVNDASVDLDGATFVGSATGVRYLTHLFGLLFTNGGGANFIPGNSAGTADGATFGLYI